jgi:hypothetical protein
MLCIKKHYNKHYVFVFVFFFQFELNIHIDKTGQRLSGQLVFNKKCLVLYKLVLIEFQLIRKKVEHKYGNTVTSKFSKFLTKLLLRYTG